MLDEANRRIPEFTGATEVARQDALLTELAASSTPGVFNIQSFGADGGGGSSIASTNRVAIQAAVDAAKAVHGTVYFPPGVYYIDGPISTASSGSSHTGTTFLGTHRPHNYNDATFAVVLVPSATFPTGEAVIDLRYTVQAGVYFIGIDGGEAKQAGKMVTGIEFGYRADDLRSGLFSHLEVDHCNIHNLHWGIRARRGSILRIHNNNVSGCAYVGVGLEEDAGDSDIAENYVNTNNYEYVGTDDYSGTGILVAAGSNNVNIRGGKVEYNAKGILIYGSNGVNVNGVNFDSNAWLHVWISPLDDGPRACRGFSILGNRFLAGGTFARDPIGPLGKVHIQVTALDGTAAVGTIVGNTFRKAGWQAYDLAPGTPDRPAIGPANYALVVESGTMGRADVVLAGNDMLDCADAATMASSGGNSTIYNVGNATNLPYETYSGGAIRNAAPDEF
jgi:hypothetical protein